MAKINLAATVDSLDAVPEKFHSFYTETDGKYSLDADLAETLDTSGLKSALDKERKTAKEKAAAVARWEALGKTPEEIEELIAKLEEAETKGKEKAGDIEGLKKQYDEKLNKALAPYQTKAQLLERKLSETLVRSAALQAISEQKGVAKLLLPHVNGRARVVEEDGDYVVKVFQPDGKTVMVNDSGDPATIADLVASMKEDPDFARAFEASGTTGSGTQTSGKSTATGSGNKKRSQMTEREAADFIEKNGRMAYLGLPY